MRRILRRHPLLHRLPQPLQARLPRECRSRHKVRSFLPCCRPRSCQDQPSLREADPSRCQDPNRWYVTSSALPFHAKGPFLIRNTEVPKQVCMTKDNVNLQLTSVIYYHITSPHKAAFGISNIRQALVERTQTTLRHVVGARVLQDVIERREEIAQSIGEIIEDVASGWGVQVESMLIKDIIFSTELQDSLSMAAQSKRIGESKVIAARAEVESAKLMRQAADILSSAPAMQIRYLEAMQAMAKTANSKV